MSWEWRSVDAEKTNQSLMYPYSVSHWAKPKAHIFKVSRPCSKLENRNGQWMDKAKHIINHHTQRSGSTLWGYEASRCRCQIPLGGFPGLRSEPTEPSFLNTRLVSLGRGREEPCGILITPLVSPHFSQAVSLLVSYTAEGSLRGGMEALLLSSPPDHTWLSEAKWLVSEVGHTEPHQRGKWQEQPRMPRGLEHSPQQGLQRENCRSCQGEKVSQSKRSAVGWNCKSFCGFYLEPCSSLPRSHCL